MDFIKAPGQARPGKLPMTTTRLETFVDPAVAVSWSIAISWKNFT